VVNYFNLYFILAWYALIHHLKIENLKWTDDCDNKLNSSSSLSLLSCSADNTNNHEDRSIFID